MDPSSLAQSFATVVGLLCSFRQERGATEALDHRQFIEWLEYHRHVELKRLISGTLHLSREIDDLLHRDQGEILQKLSDLDGVFASILSRLDGFSGLAAVLAPGVEISAQAKQILTVFADSEAQLLILMPNVGSGPIVCFSPGVGITIEEPRFVEDDLATLSKYGLLAQDLSSSGEPLFKLTRNGATYAKLLKEQSGIAGA